MDYWRSHLSGGLGQNTDGVNHGRKIDKGEMNSNGNHEHQSSEDSKDKSDE